MQQIDALDPVQTPSYPPGPADAPADSASPTLSYRRRARWAVIALVSFLVVYAGLILWFGILGIYLTVRVFNARPFELMNLMLAIIALSLCGVLTRALFFIAAENQSTGVEMTLDEQPQLHDFIRRLAHVQDFE